MRRYGQPTMSPYRSCHSPCPEATCGATSRSTRAVPGGSGCLQARLAATSRTCTRRSPGRRRRSAPETSALAEQLLELGRWLREPPCEAPRVWRTGFTRSLDLSLLLLHLREDDPKCLDPRRGALRGRSYQSSGYSVDGLRQSLGSERLGRRAETNAFDE